MGKIKKKNKKDRQYWSLNNKDFSYFRGQVEYWRVELGIEDWDITVEKEAVQGGDYQARFQFWPNCRRVLVTLNMVWDEEPGNWQLDKVAFHEVFESVYFGKFRYMCREIYNDSYVDEVTHTSLIRAENTIFEVMRGS